MPRPRPRPDRRKSPFTPEDNILIIELKEQKNLQWKQIEYFFPGRSANTIQVHYCVYLKNRDILWTEEIVSIIMYNYRSIHISNPIFRLTNFKLP